MHNNIVDRLGDASLEELITGMRAGEHAYECMVCGTSFRKGVIYRDGEALVDAGEAARRHVAAVHGGMLQVLLALPKEWNGLTETQRTIAEAVASKLSDREIARSLGGRAASTVRNHRFQLKRRFTEAKVLTALAAIVDESAQPESEFISYHSDIPVDDDRIVTTVAEARSILAHYMDESGGLTLVKFPKKEKEKLVLLQRITREFDRTRRYTEPEVNDILRAIYADYVTIRRYLIEYRFLDRVPGGAEYWVNA